MRSAMRLVVSTTVPETTKHFLLDHLVNWVRDGWEVHLVTSPGRELDYIKSRLTDLSGIYIHVIDMKRLPSVLRDLRAFKDWIVLLRELRPHVVLAGTPKAGMLGMLSAWIVGVPTRIYWLHGLRLEGLSGLVGLISRYVEKFTCSASTVVLCVSESLKRAVSDRELAKGHKCLVLGRGSPAGVDVHYFSVGTEDQKSQARVHFGLPLDQTLVGFAGRLTPDKGLQDLIEATRQLIEIGTDVHLVVVGSREEESPLSRDVSIDYLGDSVSWLGYQTDMLPFYRAIDIFCLPSYREGMPTVNLEAAACGLPVVTTISTGCVDSVQDEQTGILVLPRAPDQLAQAINRLCKSPDLRSRLGLMGREWAVANFSQDVLLEKHRAFLQEGLR